VAANLGSMATPVGNPQNLYLYAAYELSAGEFFSTVLPLTAVSLVVLVLAALPVLPRELDVPELGSEELEKEKLWTYGWLFGLCLLTVFRVLPYGAVTGVVIVTILWRDPRRLKEADISLLLTFVCFFIVSGNLGGWRACGGCFGWRWKKAPC
jgi:Na+/H+ antiporter NhaD/arsenite permease-like protein